MIPWAVRCFVVLLPLTLVAAGPDPAATSSSAPATSGPALQRVLGEVMARDAAAGRMTVKTEAGQAVEVGLSNLTTCLRAQPGAKDLSSAAPIPCVEIALADRVFARGALAPDGQTVAARQVVLMTRGDLTRKQDQERADWQKRGVAGVVKSLDAGAKTVTLEVRGLGEARELVLATEERKAAFLRYAPGSARFSEAKPSSFEELKVGDQVRALGDRSADGARVTAEQVVAGAFRTVLGKIDSVQPEPREIALTSLAPAPGSKDKAKEKLVIVLGADVALKRLPAEMATRLAARRNGAGLARGGRFGGGAWRTGERPAGAGAGPGGLGGGIGMAGRAANLGEMLDRLPSIALTDLTRGEVVAVAIAEGGADARKPATALLAGIEPLVTESASLGGPGFGGAGMGAEDLDLGMGFSQ